MGKGHTNATSCSSMRVPMGSSGHGDGARLGRQPTMVITPISDNMRISTIIKTKR
jgi:hypothetical protein